MIGTQWIKERRIFNLKVSVRSVLSTVPTLLSEDAHKASSVSFLWASVRLKTYSIALGTSWTPLLFMEHLCRGYARSVLTPARDFLRGGN